ncbi:hypothetical protein GOODEAATRI_032886 [Goodea atripinnis]|uniref:Cytochrome c biogenesis B n=1 Tax=Goodea atripinnis TaxID=208336 RepID=A0ABV0NZK4_9TELE
MSGMENRPLFRSLSVTMMHLGTETWYRLILCELVLGSSNRIRSVPIKVQNLVPIQDSSDLALPQSVGSGQETFQSLQFLTLNTHKQPGKKKHARTTYLIGGIGGIPFSFS